MVDNATQTRDCPYCREEVRADALRCKHCQATITPEQPGHGGVCPFCKEQINAEAIRCKHCHADLAPRASTTGGCGGGCAGCGGAQPPSTYAARATTPTMGIRRAVPRNSRAAGSSDLAFDEGTHGADRGCSDFDIDEAGTWCFLESSANYCIYELCEPVTKSPYGIFNS
jgi:hypothetical protein